MFFLYAGLLLNLIVIGIFGYLSSDRAKRLKFEERQKLQKLMAIALLLSVFFHFFSR